MANTKSVVLVMQSKQVIFAFCHMKHKKSINKFHDIDESVRTVAYMTGILFLTTV